MTNFRALLRLNFKALLATMRVGRKKRSFSGLGALALVAGLSVYVSGVYSAMLAEQLAPVGALPLLLVLMSLVAVMLGFFFSLFAAQGVVFGARDNDLMLSLPISPFVLMLSRVSALYLENMVSTVFVLLPAGVIYLWYGGPGGWAVLPLLLVSALFLNLLPTLLTGLLAVDGGLFYGGGVRFFLTQCLGVVSVIAWVAVTMLIIFNVIKRTVGLRATATERWWPPVQPTAITRAVFPSSSYRGSSQVTKSPSRRRNSWAWLPLKA